MMCAREAQLPGHVTDVLDSTLCSVCNFHRARGTYVPLNTITREARITERSAGEA